MALPALLRKVFESDGYGPKLNRSIIPFAPSLASDSAVDVASTEWVKDVGVTPIYVDAGASAGGDGLSAATAFNNLGDAIVLSRSLNQSRGRIYVAGGTYGGVYVNQIRCEFVLQGEVVISGSLTITEKSNVVFTGNSNKLTCTAGIVVVDGSKASFFGLYQLVAAASGASAVRVESRSYARFASPCDFTASGTGAVAAFIDSTVLFENNHASYFHGSSISYAAISIVSSFVASSHILNVDATAVNGIIISSNASADFYGAVNIGSNLTTGNGLVAEYGAHCNLHNGCDIFSGTSDGNEGNGAINVAYGSTICFSSGASIVNTIRSGHALTNGLIVSTNSVAIVSGKLVIVAHGSNNSGYSALCVDNGACVLFAKGYVHEFWSHWSTAVISCFRNSVVYVGANVTLGGQPTGKKFTVRFGGQLNTGGRIAANAMPGDNNSYTIDTNTFGYFY